MRKSEVFRKVVSAGLCAAMVLALVLTGVGLKAEAASYSGRGSKSDPYLVETAQQLQDMNNNLSAHYKLANTIDLTGVAFTPIGSLGAPFTGSFVCELDSDGTPKYAIKNLSVSIVGVPNYADYVTGKSKWQAALFGSTKGATLTNIALLDVKISNTVEGKNQMNSDYTINPGMDDMSASALVGHAYNSTISGCSATGVIDSRANGTAGLVGFMQGGSLTKSYAKMTIKSTGKWNNGGLVGVLKAGTEISECFADVDLTGAQSSAVGFDAGENSTGGLIGGSGSGTGNGTIVIKNCYSTGSVCESGNSLVGEESSYLDYVSDCYTTGKVNGVSGVKSGTSTKNCFVLNASGCCQKSFTAGSEAEIKAAFASNSAWDTSGALPTLKNVKIITDTSKYVPAAGSTPPAQDDPSAPPASGGTVIVPTEPEKSTAAADYAGKVADYLTKAQNETITLDEAFDVLTLDEMKAAMTSEEILELSELNPYINDDYSSLITKVKLFLVSKVVTDVDAFPTAEEMTDEYLEQVFEAYELYQRLPEEFREAVNDKTVSKLEASYEKAYQMKYVTILEPGAQGQALSDSELILVITFGAICLIAFVGVVITTVRIIKYTRTEKKKV